MKQWMLLGALALPLIFSSFPASACPLCRGVGVSFSAGQQLDAADQAVLATPVVDWTGWRILEFVVRSFVAPGGGPWAGGTGWRILEVVKGAAIAGQVITEPVDGAAEAAMATSRPLLLLHLEGSPRWASVGPVSVEYAGWLRQFTASGPRADRPGIDWRGRVTLVAPYLEGPEPLAAEIAYGEITRAPYGALRPLKPQLQAAAIARWLDDPKLSVRQPAYTILLGIAGGPEDAERLEQRLDAAWASQDATNLAAMLASDLELRGPSRVEWIEKMYLTDRRRTMAEIASAIQALREHGVVDGAVPRARVIQAYFLLIKERQPMAGLVAADLMEWEYWDAAAEYGTLLKSNLPLDPASRSTIITYLERCPRAEAKAALASLPSSSVGSLVPGGQQQFQLPDIKVIR